MTEDARLEEYRKHIEDLYRAREWLDKKNQRFREWIKKIAFGSEDGWPGMGESARQLLADVDKLSHHAIHHQNQP